MSTTQGELFTSLDDFSDYITDLVEDLDTPELIDTIEILPEWAEGEDIPTDEATVLATALIEFLAERFDTSVAELREGAISMVQYSSATEPAVHWATACEYFRQLHAVHAEARALTETRDSAPAAIYAEESVTKESPSVPAKVWEPGAIAVSSWGYEQTNVDFYEVTRTTAKSMWLRPIQSKILAAESDMVETVVPVPGAYTGAEFRRARPAGGDGVSISSYAYARPWNGEPCRASHYA